MRAIAARRGNAATEYILIAAVVVAILAGISQAGTQHCVKNLSGDTKQCDSLPEMIEQSFQKSVEEMTFLINLPF